MKEVKEKKNKNANELIPELIIKINKYSSKIKDRVKVDSIFREFDSYAHSNFQNFIKMSEQRYKSVKSGNSIQNILSKQKQEANILSNKILTNNLYIDNDIEKENRKLFKKINKKENQELYKIRRKIIEKTKNLSSNDSKKIKPNKNLGEKSIQNSPNKIFKFDWMRKSKYKSDIHNSLNNTMKDTNIINQINEDKENKYYYEKKEFIDNLVEKDKKNLNNNICYYKEYLKDLEKMKVENISKLINSGNNLGHNYSFQLKDIKLLSYQEEKKEEKKLLKKENGEIDLVKLLRYTKRGNRKFFQNNLKVRKKERLNSFNKKYKKKSKSSFSSAINIRRNYIEKICGKDEGKESKNNVNYLMNSTSSTTFTKFKNTLKTVKNEAEMIRVLDKTFNIKKHTMEGFFKRNALPRLEDYEKMFKTKNFFINNNKKNKKNKKTENNKNNNSSNLNQNLNNQKVNKEIFEDFQRTYYNKKIKWEKEDKQKERIKERDKALIEDVKIYLKEIKQIKRKPQLYSDPYSKKDELINNRIKLFTRSLSEPFYSQKKLQSKIDDFNNYIELKEYEKKINDKKSAKYLKVEEKQKKGKHEKLMEKMKEQLEIDNSDEEDKKFNYKFISSLKLCKKEEKNQPYKDYKESFEIIKEKKRKGEYDDYY